MKQFQLSARDRARIKDIHPDLANVVRLAATVGMPFMVLEGRRTIERQRQLLKQKATRTLNSRHLTGHAVDLAPLLNPRTPSWHWPHYRALAPVVKAAAEQLKIPVEWGGDWVSFPDGPHWQLPWAEYPA